MGLNLKPKSRPNVDLLSLLDELLAENVTFNVLHIHVVVVGAGCTLFRT